MERARDELGDPVGVVDLLDPLRHRAEHVAVVDLLERLPAHHVAADLADQEDQRRRVLEGGVDAAGGVRRAGAARDHADARPAGELAVGVGHVRRADLVTAGDEADRRVVERVEHRQVALARHAEGDVHPVDHELVDEEPASRPHVRSSRCSRKTVGFWSFGDPRRQDRRSGSCASRPTRPAGSARGRRRSAGAGDASASTGSGPASNQAPPGPVRGGVPLGVDVDRRRGAGSGCPARDACGV